MSSMIYDYTNDFTKLSNSMKLDSTTIGKFIVAKEFSENKARINSIDFSQDGKNLISSSDDDTIILYDCERGSKKREIMSKKYGVDLIRYTHANNTAIHTSTKENDTIRYLSLHDNKYLKYFVGHEKRVITLAMSPADDTFLSGSLDQTVRLWDLRSDKPVAKLTFQGLPVVNYDPEGLIFAVGINSELIKLFDLRLYEKGPFNTFKFAKPQPRLIWKSLKFSPDGKQMLITTNFESMYILDAFSGQPLNKDSIGPELPNPIENPSEASYSPDSQFILSGSYDGCLHIWSTNYPFNRVQTLRPQRTSPDPVQCVKFNPRYMMIASACSKMSFWIPRSEEI